MAFSAVYYDNIDSALRVTHEFGVSGIIRTVTIKFADLFPTRYFTMELSQSAMAPSSRKDDQICILSLNCWYLFREHACSRLGTEIVSPGV